jgi:hypothetical protein
LLAYLVIEIVFILIEREHGEWEERLPKAEGSMAE